MDRLSCKYCERSITMKKEALGGLLVLAIVLYVLIQVAWPGSKFGAGTKLGDGWQYLVNGKIYDQNSPQQFYQSPAAGTGGSSVVGSPSLSAQRIDSILCNAGSPACGIGQTFYSDGVQYGIDPAYALAFFKHESSFGTAGMATQTHSIGNIVCTPGYDCIGRFRAYRSWADGVHDWFHLIKNLYIDKWDCTTVESIISHYAPSSDNNDESGYIANVESDVQSWRQS
jgi:hypothetical protein